MNYELLEKAATLLHAGLSKAEMEEFIRGIDGSEKFTDELWVVLCNLHDFGKVRL